MKVYDLSPLVSPRLAVFPGDRPFARPVAMDFAAGDHLTLSAIETTLHLGSHGDAPVHYHPDGVGADALDVRLYLGPVQVFDVRGRGAARVAPDDLGDDVRAPRVLLRTDSYPDPDTWRDDFRAVAPELIDFLADRGVVLVGIDTPSVDVADSKDLPSHARLFARRMANLEGLVLTDVPAGLYGLVAVPLRLAGADASPVRALLLPAGTIAEGLPAGPTTTPTITPTTQTGLIGDAP